MAQEKLNIYQKLAKIRKRVEFMQKDTKGYNYTYTREESILAKVTVDMDKLGLMLIPSIVPGTFTYQPYTYTKTKTDRKGETYEEINNEVLVRSEMTWTWVDIEDPTQRVEVPWILAGQQGDMSRAFGSALTYSSRYFLLKFFNIATSDDDPDEFRRRQKEAEDEEKAQVASEITKAIDAYAKKLVANNPDISKDLTNVVSKFVKNGNYFSIKDPILANGLLNELRKTFGLEDSTTKDDAETIEKEND